MLKTFMQETTYHPVYYRIEFWSAKGFRHTLNSLPPEAVPAVIHEIEIHDGQVISIHDQI